MYKIKYSNLNQNAGSRLSSSSSSKSRYPIIKFGDFELPYEDNYEFISIIIFMKFIKIILTTERYNYILSNIKIDTEKKKNLSLNSIFPIINEIFKFYIRKKIALPKYNDYINDLEFYTNKKSRDELDDYILVIREILAYLTENFDLLYIEKDLIDEINNLMLLDYEILRIYRDILDPSILEKVYYYANDAYNMFKNNKLTTYEEDFKINLDNRNIQNKINHRNLQYEEYENKLMRKVGQFISKNKKLEKENKKLEDEINIKDEMISKNKKLEKKIKQIEDEINIDKQFRQKNQGIVKLKDEFGDEFLDIPGQSKKLSDLNSVGNQSLQSINSKTFEDTSDNLSEISINSLQDDSSVDLENNKQPITAKKKEKGQDMIQQIFPYIDSLQDDSSVDLDQLIIDKDQNIGEKEKQSLNLNDIFGDNEENLLGKDIEDDAEEEEEEDEDSNDIFEPNVKKKKKNIISNESVSKLDNQENLLVKNEDKKVENILKIVTNPQISQDDDEDDEINSLDSIF